MTGSELDQAPILATVLDILYALLIGLGLIAMFLLLGALRHADTARVTGRLWSTLLVLGGLTTAAAGRINDSITLVTIGLVSVDTGMIGYIIWLPERGVLVLWDRWRAARSARAARRKDAGGAA